MLRRPHYEILLKLQELLEEAARTYFIGVEDEALLNDILRVRKKVEKKEIDGKAIGIDGSLASENVLGGLTLYAISAGAFDGSVWDLYDSYALVFLAYQTPHLNAAATLLMLSMEAFYAYKAVRSGAKYTITDGMLTALYNMVTGIVGGIQNTLESALINVLREAGLRDLNVEIDGKPLVEVVGEDRFYVSRRTYLYKAMQEAIGAAVKKLDEGINRRRPGITEEFARIVLFEDYYHAFRSTFSRMFEDVIDRDILEAYLYGGTELSYKDELLPLVLAYASYGLFVKSILRAIENLSEDQYLIGASKRIHWNTVSLAPRIYAPYEKLSKIGRMITMSDRIPVPGYLEEARPRGAYMPATLKVTGHIEGIDKLRRLFLGEGLEIKRAIVKPSYYSVLRLEVIAKHDIRLSEVISELSSLAVSSPGASGGTASLAPVEAAHREVSIDRSTIYKLASLFRREVRRGFLVIEVLSGHVRCRLSGSYSKLRSRIF